MKILIRDMLSSKIEEYELKNVSGNTIEYSDGNDKYIWKILEKSLSLEKIGELGYNFTFSKGKLTKSKLNLNNMEFILYILTRRLEITNSNIILQYNIYSDEDIRDMVSSYEVIINLMEE